MAAAMFVAFKARMAVLQLALRILRFAQIRVAEGVVGDKVNAPKRIGLIYCRAVQPRSE